MGSAECEPPAPAHFFTNISLTAPTGQGPYVHNGNILTFKGTAPSHATLISARLKDNQDHMIRDVAKGLKLSPNTGSISGSIFVGSFREAVFVHLDIIIQVPTDSQPVKGTSNTLIIDNSYPKIQITNPKNHSSLNTAWIDIYGTASDNLSGIAAVEISLDDGFTYYTVDSFNNGQWQYSFKPSTPDTEYTIKARSTDTVGLETVSDKLVIHYSPPPPEVKRIAKKNSRIPSDYPKSNTNKSPDDNGICTYRIIKLKSNRFQPTDLFTLKEDMAIIVKGYGGKMVTIKIIAASSEKVVFELTDYIPENKNKMWEWKLSQTGGFQAELLVDGIVKDNVFFKIVQ